SNNSGRWSLGSSANKLTLQDLLGDVAHAGAPAHRRLLDDLEGGRLVQAPLLHQQFLGPLDNLAGLDLVVDVAHFRDVRRVLDPGVQDGGQLGQDLTRAKRLYQIGQHAGVAGALDEGALTERGEQHHHRARSLQLARDFNPVEARHLDVEQGEVRFKLLDHGERVVAAGRFTDHQVAVALENLLQVEAD